MTKTFITSVAFAALLAGSALADDKEFPAKLAGQAIRISLPWNAIAGDVAAFAAAYRRMAERLRLALAPRAA